MRVRDQISMARRNLRRQKGRTRLTLLSIIIGAFAVILVIILSSTANQAVTNYFEETGDLFSIEVQRVGGDVPIDEALAKRVGDLEGVQSYTPRLGMYDYPSIRFEEQSVNMVGGVDLSAERSNGTTDRVILAGRDLNDSDTGAQALVSADIARELTGGDVETLVDSTVYLVTQESYQGPNQSADNCDFGDFMSAPVCSPVEIPVTVVGVVQANLSVFFPLEFGVAERETTFYFPDERCDPDSEYWQFQPGPFTANAGCDGILGSDTFNIIDDVGWDRLKIRVVSDEAIEGVSSALANDLGMRNRLDTQGEGFLEFSVGRDELQEILQLTTLATLIFLAVGGISLLVSAIGVVNTMTMATLERTREIGVMRALGARRSDVTRVFTVESGLIGFLGGMWGFIFAAATVLILFAATDGLATLDVGFSLELPLLLQALIPATLVVGLTTVIGIFAGVTPARRAAKLDTVESLRSE